MARKTVLHTKEAACREAVELLVGRLASATSLRPRLAEAPEDDVEFEDGSGGTPILVEWQEPARESEEPGEWEVDDEEEVDEARDGATRLYESTLEVVATDPEAARAVIARLGPGEEPVEKKARE